MRPELLGVNWKRERQRTMEAFTHPGVVTPDHKDVSVYTERV